MRRSRRYVTSLLVVLALMAVWMGGYGSQTATGQVAIDCDDFLPPVPADASGGTPNTAGARATPGPATFPAGGGEITVFAAASLTDAFESIATDIYEANPDVSVTFNFAGSQALVTQLTEGAEADVFASANISQMNAAIDAGIIAGDSENFAQNHLVIVVPADNPAGIASFADLANDGIAFVTALTEVPVGQYTRQAICAAGQEADAFGHSFVEAVASNIVSEEENTTAIVTKISLGEGDAGIVYQTDVTPDLADSVTIIPIEPELNVVATYPIALVEGGNSEFGGAFIEYVLSSEGQATLAEFGFGSKPE